MGSFSIHYDFQLPNKVTRPFEVKIDDQTISYIPQTRSTPPESAKLEVGQCQDCPLNMAESPFFPIAVNLAELMLAFKDEISRSSNHFLRFNDLILNL